MYSVHRVPNQISGILYDMTKSAIHWLQNIIPGDIEKISIVNVAILFQILKTKWQVSD